MAVPDPLSPEPGPNAGIDEIQADIARTREQLGETVSALTGKLDVKAQAQQRVEAMRAKAAPAVPVAVVVALAALAGLVIWRRRH